MHTTQCVGRTGPDGTLTLTVPLGQPNAEFEVLVVVQAQTVTAAPPPTDPWAGAKAIFARLSAGGRTFSDSVEMIREDRDR